MYMFLFDNANLNPLVNAKESPNCLNTKTIPQVGKSYTATWKDALYINSGS